MARFHNIFGPFGTWKGDKEKVPAAILRKVIEAPEGGEIEVLGDGTQTRSFLYVQDCIDAVLALMGSDYTGPVNIGLEEMVSINRLAALAIELAGKNLRIRNLQGEAFFKKYGFPCPLGVMGRNSNNRLFEQKVGKTNFSPLIKGLTETFPWIEKQVVNESSLIK